MRCPKCGTLTKTARGLTRHLTGGAKYGGHDIPLDQAVLLVAEASEVSVPAQNVETPRPIDVPEHMKSGFFYRSLSHVVENKDLPKYQFERIIDFCLGIFIPRILEAQRQTAVQLVTQEFPLKKPDNYQSTNMDYVLYQEAAGGSSGRWLFLELKTDPRSVRFDQNDIYNRLMESGRSMRELVQEIREIQAQSSQPEKYEEPLERLAPYDSHLEEPIELLFMSPVPVHVPGAEKEPEVILFRNLQDLDLTEFDDEWDLFKALAIPQLL